MANGQKAKFPVKYEKNLQEQQQRDGELSDYVFGKVPPQALALEEAVLGAIMLDRDALVIVIDILHEQCFYPEAHQLIFAAMLRLFNQSQPIDLLTVMDACKKAATLEKIGGPAYLASLTNKVASAANIEYHARIIKQQWVKRELIRYGTIVIREAYEDTSDCFDILEAHEKGIFSISAGNSKSYESAASLTNKLWKDLQNQGDSVLSGVPSGLTELDAVTNGYQRTDLIIQAARPGMGKTSKALSEALHAAKQGHAVAFFSLEMSSMQLMARLAAMECGVSFNKFRFKTADENEWAMLEVALGTISNLPIYIDDTPSINVFELRAKCRRMKMQHDIQIIFIDYLQLMGGSGSNFYGNREQEISGISRSLKALAKELEVPVIALAQLSRAVETRGGSKRPQLSDLRESGSIENDADIVQFIYRSEYYGIVEDPEGQSLKGVAEIIIAKHRNGALKDVRVRFNATTTKFSDLEDKDAEFMNAITTEPLTDDVFKQAAPSNYLITRPSKMNDDEDIEF